MAQWSRLERYFAYGAARATRPLSQPHPFRKRYSAAAPAVSIRETPPTLIANTDMHFTYEQRTFCANLDWLQFSVHLTSREPEIMCPDGYRLEICQGNNIFEHRAIVYDQRGSKFLTLLWSPFSKVLPENLMTCQVSNEYLYLPAGQGIKWAWEVLQEIVECTFNAIGRVDICCDFEGNKQVTQFLNHLNSGHYYAQRKSEGSSWWHEVTSAGHPHKQLHCLTWGSPKSEIRIKIYHKSREQGILEGGEPSKPWIVSEWKQAGMNVRNVWRLEFALCGAGQLRYNNKPITLADVMNSGWLLGVLCDMFRNRFVTRVNQGRRNGHHNNDQRVWLFHLPSNSVHLQWAEPSIQPTECPAAITLLRSLMRQVDNPAVLASADTFSDYASTILNLINLQHLSGYFLRTWEAMPEDYFSDLYKHVGSGLRTCTLPPARLMD